MKAHLKTIAIIFMLLTILLGPLLTPWPVHVYIVYTMMLVLVPIYMFAYDLVREDE